MVDNMHLTEVSAQISVATTGDKFTFTPGRPVDIVRWGIIADVLIDVGVGMTIAADHRITAGSDTGRVNAAVGTITDTDDIAQGDGVYTENVSPLITARPTETFRVDPGEQVVFEVTDAADTAGTGHIFIEYRQIPFVGDANVAAGLDSNRIAGFTKVTS